MHSDSPTWKFLISCPLVAHECISLITAIFSDKNEIGVVQSLRGDNAQAFIDKIDKVPLHTYSSWNGNPPTQTFNSADQALDLPDLIPWLRIKCLSTLHSMCGHQGLLPRSLQIAPYYNQLDAPHCRSGYADIWMGRHQGLQVAVKVLRVYSTSHFDKIIKAGSL